MKISTQPFGRRGGWPFRHDTDRPGTDVLILPVLVLMVLGVIAIASVVFMTGLTAP